MSAKSQHGGRRPGAGRKPLLGVLTQLRIAQSFWARREKRVEQSYQRWRSKKRRGLPAKGFVTLYIKKTGRARDIEDTAKEWTVKLGVLITMSQVRTCLRVGATLMGDEAPKRRHTKKT